MDEESGTLTVQGRAAVSYRFRIKCFAAPATVTGADSWRYEKESQCLVVDKRGTSFSVGIPGLKGYGRKK
jgi:hypothetical protein